LQVASLIRSPLRAHKTAKHGTAYSRRPLPPPTQPNPQQARDEEFICKDLLEDLPPLTERVHQIRVGRGAATNAADNDRQLLQSQEEYVKGVSSWNFDLERLKAQAAAEPDADGSVPQTPTYAPSMPTSESCPPECCSGGGLRFLGED